MAFLGANKCSTNHVLHQVVLYTHIHGQKVLPNLKISKNIYHLSLEQTLEFV